MEETSPLFFKLLSSQTCFTPLESENWRHGSVKNWTTVPQSPWGTSRMLARQGLPVKSMFCLWRLRCREYTNATCYRPSAQSCAYLIQQLMGFGWGSLSWTDLHFLLQWLYLKAVSHEIFIRLDASFCCCQWFKRIKPNIFQIVSSYHFSIGSIVSFFKKGNLFPFECHILSIQANLCRRSLQGSPRITAASCSASASFGVVDL